MSRTDPEFRPELDDELPADTIVECPHCADAAEQWADFLKEQEA